MADEPPIFQNGIVVKLLDIFSADQHLAFLHIGLTVIRKSNIPKFNIMALGKICSTLINRNIQYLLGLGNSVQSSCKVCAQFL